MTPPPADCASTPDAWGDTIPRLDITRVITEYAQTPADNLVVRVSTAHRFGRVDSDEMDVFIDTRRRDVGPEHVVNVVVGGEYALRRVDGCTDVGRFVECDSLDFGPVPSRPHRVRTLVDRGCLGDPSSVRIAVRTAHRGDHGELRRVAWSSGRRRFGRSVAAG